MSKYIFVTSGVISGLGKTVTTASLGKLLKEMNLKVKIIKFEPYLNTDKSNINPIYNGEIFVTYDGSEESLLIGKYERFLDENLDKNTCLSKGQIYKNIIQNDLEHKYNDSIIREIPHISSKIKDILRNLNNDNYDIILVDISGTVGDLETEIFLESIKQFERELNKDDYLHIHCVYAPYLECSNQLKTKPIQHSIKILNSFGLIPNVIICRTQKNVEISSHLKQKIAIYCNLLNSNYVIHLPDLNTSYEVPLKLSKENLDLLVCTNLNIPCTKANLLEYQKLIDIYENPDLPNINIAIVGKYTENNISYTSIIEALKHSSFKNNYKAKINLISSEDIELDETKDILKNYDGIIIPGGFGSKGIEGLIKTAQYARENKIPFLGIGLGLEISIIEFARNVIGLELANSLEFDTNTRFPVIYKPNENLRLGNYLVEFKENSLVRRLYGKTNSEERHRNLYEFNNIYKNTFENNGIIFSGINKDTNYVENIEYIDHPFYVCSLYHAEFLSRPNKPHPLFNGFITGIITSKAK